jgi:hypothetical protein
VNRPGEVWPDPLYWTDEQRRRAEALILARVIFETVAAPSALVPVAQWITTGRWADS